jgi:hypothetical protein
MSGPSSPPPPALDALLAAHAGALSLQDDGRVRDVHTGHTMKVDAVAAYVR